MLPILDRQRAFRRLGEAMLVQPSDVRQFLDRSGWSQARLAWELGINQPRISRFITGMKKPNRELQGLLEAFFATDPQARRTLKGDAIPPLSTGILGSASA